MTEKDFDDDANFAADLWWFETAAAAATRSKIHHEWSVKVNKSNNPRDWEGLHMWYVLGYFWPEDEVRTRTTHTGPSDSDKDFERRFRIP